jgi:hypothetical protein
MYQTGEGIRSEVSVTYQLVQIFFLDLPILLDVIEKILQLVLDVPALHISFAISC